VNIVLPEKITELARDHFDSAAWDYSGLSF
jgi:hypothetical protein